MNPYGRKYIYKEKKNPKKQTKLKKKKKKKSKPKTKQDWKIAYTYSDYRIFQRFTRHSKGTC